MVISKEHNHMSRESDHLACSAAKNRRGREETDECLSASAARQCQDVSFKNKTCCQKLYIANSVIARKCKALLKEKFLFEGKKGETPQGDKN